MERPFPEKRIPFARIRKKWSRFWIFREFHSRTFHSSSTAGGRCRARPVDCAAPISCWQDLPLRFGTLESHLQSGTMPSSFLISRYSFRTVIAAILMVSVVFSSPVARGQSDLARTSEDPSSRPEFQYKVIWSSDIGSYTYAPEKWGDLRVSLTNARPESRDLFRSGPESSVWSSRLASGAFHSADVASDSDSQVRSQQRTQSESALAGPGCFHLERGDAQERIGPVVA